MCAERVTSGHVFVRTLECGNTLVTPVAQKHVPPAATGKTLCIKCGTTCEVVSRELVRDDQISKPAPREKRVSARNSMRLLQELACLHWSCASIAERVKAEPHIIVKIRSGQYAGVPAELDRRITKLRAEIGNTVGTSTHANKIAQKQGWTWRASR